ncbi:MAG: hypothetical protein WB562_16535 [Candidatus Sulfotelmatobacter sp.]
MRKFALVLAAFAVLSFVSVAHSQQIDLALGVGTILSSGSNSISQAYPPPAERGGTFPSVSAGFIRKNHIGFNAEVTGRYREALYNGYQGFRPVFYDVNAVFAPRLSKKSNAEFMAGVGGETLVFYNRFHNCNYVACTTYTNSNHLMGHVGGGIRYYFWRSFFIRPEAHLYFIHNNFQFSSDYVARVGASIGYTRRLE